MTTTPVYSIVVPVYNERESLRELARRLLATIDQLDGLGEVILVDDGSTDGSAEEMLELAEAEPRIRAIVLARNFGHQIAVSAGIDHVRGSCAVIMDADLQDPPELIPELVARWREGYEVVYAVRRHRADESWFKKSSAALYYRVLRRLTETDIPADVGDFRLVDRKVVDVVRRMPERSRFLRGMFSWVGYRQIGVPYSRDPRHSGTTKYPLRKMLKFASDGVISFSNLPLRLALNLGFAVSLLAFLAGLASLLVKVLGGYTVPGWTSLAVITSFSVGIQLVVLGVMGEYVGRIYEEVKRRPLYIVRDDSEQPGDAAPDGPLPGMPEYLVSERSS